MPAIDVDSLVVHRGGRPVVAGVTLSVEAGEVVCVLGPNGAGKTTTVETLEGYRRPDGGSVRVLGLDPVADHARLVASIGVMLQAGGVHPGLRAAEALRLHAAFHADPLDPDDLLERVGLAAVARSPWRVLSGGEQQRLSLALALVGRPRVAFLDEPTAGVDVGGRQVIRAIVGELRHDGVAVLVTTHELEEAERLADRVLILDAGAVVAEGTPDELMRAGAGEEIRFGAPPALDTAALADALGAPVVEVAAGEYRVGAAPTPAAVAALTAWLADHDLPLADLRAGRSSLEDVFLRLTADPSSSRSPSPGRPTRRRTRGGV